MEYILGTYIPLAKFEAIIPRTELLSHLLHIRISHRAEKHENNTYIANYFSEKYSTIRIIRKEEICT